MLFRHTTERKEQGMTDSYVNEVTKRLLQIADVAYTAGCGLNTSNPWGAVTTYPPTWLQVYVREGYQSIDPVLMFMSKGRGAINWRDLQGDDQSLAVMEHAKEFGLHNGTVYSNPAQGLKCSVSVCHHKETLDDDELAVLKEYTTIYGTTKRRIGTPPRDELCLRYLDLQANGASPSDVQKVLNVSARSVAELKKDAILSMEAKSLPQAISIAMDANLI